MVVHLFQTYFATCFQVEKSEDQNHFLSETLLHMYDICIEYK